MEFITVCVAALVSAKHMSHFASAGSLPLKFVTSLDRPSSLLNEPVVYDSPRDLTITSRPYIVHDRDHVDLDVDGVGEQTLGEWKQWLSKTQNRTLVKQNNPNEKTFTQQQIMDKLFNDYHKHLQEQKKPARVHSPWPLDTDVDDGSVRPADAMTNLKFDQLQNFQSKPPKDGWVSMEPVPWSVSKISKWTPNKVSQQPFDRPQSVDNGHWSNDRPSDKPQTSYWTTERPHWSNDSPHSISFGSGAKPQRPSYSSGSKPQIWGSGESEPWHEPANQPAWSNVPVEAPEEDSKPWNSVPKPQWGSTSSMSKPSSNAPKPWIDTKPAWTGQQGIRPTLVTSKPFTGSAGGAGSRPTLTTQVVNHHIGIITDGKPAEWPSDPPFSSAPQHKPSSLYPGANRPQKGERPRPNYYPPHSELHDEKAAAASVSSPVVQLKPDSSAENGKWVLLSSTRGYTVPPISSGDRGTRAFKFSSVVNNVASVSTNRGIRLTVLPAKDNTSVISHGGLLEVDKSFETVESAAAQAQADSSSGIVVKIPKPIKKIKIPAKQQNVNGTVGPTPVPSPVVPSVQVFTAGQPSSAEVQNRKKALIAAIGAGMLPATMAALVPMFLGRRRRRDTSADMLEEALAQRRLFVWHRLPRSTFDVTRRRHKREAI